MDYFQWKSLRKNTKDYISCYQDLKYTACKCNRDQIISDYTLQSEIYTNLYNSLIGL